MLWLCVKCAFQQFFRIYSCDIWSLKAKLKKRNISIANKVYQRYFRVFNSYIGYTSEIDGNPILPHGPVGIFISGCARIGTNVTIMQQVTIGSITTMDSKKYGCPSIGNNVFVGAGAKVIGSVTIGDNCMIGANAVVVEDVPANSVVVNQPARIIPR